MFNANSYFFVILNVISGLLTLLGAVGIFVSLIIQRRVERLQDILEELLDLSYSEEKNTTVKIQNLIYKYQMQYSLPAQPIKTVLTYITLTVFFVILFWVWLLFLTFQGPFKAISFIYLLPMFCVSAVMVFYRQLVKSTINPVGNSLFDSIIPAPRYLRSIAFLSGYVNVAVSTIILQSRPLPVLRQKENSWSVVLKEEIPIDDYHYYCSVYLEDQVYFTGYGHIVIELDDDEITGKPRPTARNLNIPLGNMDIPENLSNLEARLLIFPKGEKHPAEFRYELSKDSNVYCSSGTPDFLFNHLITYCCAGNNSVKILINRDEEKSLSLLPGEITGKGNRHYISGSRKDLLNADSSPFED